METLWQDIRYGARMLLKNRGVSLVVILTLALGIGANTAIFSVVEAVLLRQLPYPEPEKLVIVWERNFKRNREENVVGPANYMRWKERNQSFEYLSAFSEWSGNITGVGEPERIPIVATTADFFLTLGAKAEMGRTLLPEDGKRGNDNVVVLSHGYWQRRFGGDAGIIGKSLTMNDRKMTIVGVMPADFRGIGLGELWAPLVLGEAHRNARGRWLLVLGRLKAGVSVAQAQAEMSGLAKQIEQELPDFTGGWSTNVVPLREQLVKKLQTALYVLLGAVGLVLLIGCANVANLILARATSREKEMAIRAALGAGRVRLVRQLLTESVLLALLGGAAGVLLGSWALDGLIALSPPDVERFTSIEINRHVLLFTLGLSVATGLLFGTVPALAASRSALAETLKEGGRSSSMGAARQWLKGALVVGEVAMSLMLLIGAGLLLRSFGRLQSVDSGFRTENVLSFQLTLASERYRDDEKVVQFFDQVVERIERIPGVLSAGAMSWLPLSMGSATSYRSADQPVPRPGEEPVADVRIVTPRVFETMGIPLLRGRIFTAEDSAKAPRRVVVNHTLAREMWPGQDPLGKRIFMSWGQEIEAEVIGVVGDVRMTALNTPPRATLYWVPAQLPNDFMSVLVRSAAAPESLIPAIKAEIAALDPDLPVAKLQMLEEVKQQSVKEQRFSMLLLNSMASLALALAAIGVFGVMSYAVAQRTHEIGIHMALGAQRGDVLRLMLNHGMGLTFAGLGIGLIGAFLLSRYLESLLFEVRATDPATFASVAALLVGVALLACWIPARRATRVDPMVALRYE